MMLLRGALLSILLVCDPLLRVTESWGIGILGSPKKGDNSCAAGESCPKAAEEKGEGLRGVPPRPEPETRQRWWPVGFQWLIKISLRLIHDAASTSLEYCGTLCASIGLAARWSYWLATVTVVLFLVQLTTWSFSWVIIPAAKHLTALWRYLRGSGQFYEVAHLHGVRMFRPKWIGPRGREEWSAGYVQHEVRGRGEGREPFDLLVTDGTAIARLRHGTLRGRTNRFGFKAECDTVHSCSHRYYRGQLEGMECRVHLCSSHPCGQPDDDCMHAVASAVVARNTDFDLQDAAGRGPLARCATAAWLFGYTGCGLFGSIARGFKRMLACICCSPCCRGKKRSRSRAPPSSEASTPRHDDSETESEVDDETSCQAESVAFLVNGKATPLSLTPCKDSARGEKLKLLSADAEVSSAEDLRHEDGNFYFNCCNHHRAIYEGQAAKRTCAIEGCDREVKATRNGLRLCKMHGSKEERTRTPRGRNTPSPSVPKTEEPAHSQGPEARFAPGRPAAKGPERAQSSKVSLLSKYLKSILEGKGELVGLQDCAEGDQGPRETWEELKEQASAYVTRLPKDYPPLARKAIINLVTEDCPTVPLEDDGPEDPVLGIGKTMLWEDPEAGKPPGVKLNPTQGAEMAQVAHEVLPPALKTKPTEGQAVDVANFLST